MKKFRPLPQLLPQRFLGDWCSTEAATVVTFHPRVRVAISAQGLFVARSVGCRRLCEYAAAEVVWPISGQFFGEHHVTARSHPSYRHENPRVRTPALRSPETVSNERGQAASGSTICSPSLAARFLSSWTCCSRWRFS